MNFSKQLFTIVLIASVSAQVAHAMNLDKMPREVIGQILGQMAQNVGTPKLINKEDLPVIIKYAKALSMVNKNLYFTANSTIASCMLVKVLAHRFGMDPVDVVGKLNTPGARQWLTEYLQETGEYELFKVMQRIFEIGNEVREEFEPLGFRIDNGQKNWPGSAPFYSQTKQGLYLSVGMTPDSLKTPWGEVKLFGGGSGMGLTFEAFTQAFLKRFKVSFECVTKSRYERDQVKYRELVPIDLHELLIADQKPDYESIFRNLSEKEVEARKGTDSLIFSSLCGCNSIYKLVEVDGITLPEPEMQTPERYRCSESSNLIWKILQDQYDQEKGIVKKDKVDTKKKAPEPELQPSPKNYITSIKTAPAECIRLLEQLDAQPLFTGRGSIVKTCKVLPLQNWDDCRIIRLLCDAAAKKLGKNNSWNISDFGCGNNQLVDEYGMSIKCGISEWIYADNIATRCDLSELHTALDSAVHELKTGWKQARLVEYPDIFFTESEEEWILLIKPKMFEQEDTLIRFLAGAFKLQNAVSCYNEWRNPDHSYEYRSTMYMWIKKKSYAKVLEAFDLKIDEAE